MRQHCQLTRHQPFPHLLALPNSLNTSSPPDTTSAPRPSVALGHYLILACLSERESCPNCGLRVACVPRIAMNMAQLVCRWQCSITVSKKVGTCAGSFCLQRVDPVGSMACCFIFFLPPICRVFHCYSPPTIPSPLHALCPETWLPFSPTLAVTTTLLPLNSFFPASPEGLSSLSSPVTFKVAPHEHHAGIRYA